MKNTLSIIALGLCITTTTYADNVTVNWKVGNTTYDTTTCTVGGDISLPNAPHKNGYTFVGWMNGTPVEYLQSSGTQYIYTGLVGASGSDTMPYNYEIDIQMLSTASAGDGILYNPGDPRDTDRSAGIRVVGDKIYCRTNLLTSFNVGNRLRIYSGPTTVNGQPTTVGNCSLYNYFTGSSIYLFGYTHPASIKLYSAKFWNATTGELVRDFIPALDSRGVPAMYEKVSDTFYYNNGTGSFTAGPAI